MDNITMATNNASVTESVAMDVEEPYKTIKEVIIWLSLVNVLLSLIGNTLIIVVMFRCSSHKNAVGVLLMALAISDILYMLNIPFLVWLQEKFSVNIFVMKDSALVTAKFIANYTFKATSVWMLSAVTVVRTISVALPFKVNDVCNRKIGAIVVIALTVSAIILYTILFTFVWSWGVNLDSGAIYLYTKVDDGDKIFKWIDMVFAFLIPLVIISIGSVIITVHMYRRRAIRSTYSRRDSLTGILLAANLIFIITMSPATFTNLICQNTYCGLTETHYRILFDILFFVYDLNSTLNFYVYYLSGTKFRDDVKKVFHCCRRPLNTTQTNRESRTLETARSRLPTFS